MDFKEKIKGLGFLSKRGQSIKKSVIREDDGTVGGYYTEHWDDRQDAVVQPKTIKLKAEIQDG